MSFYIFTDKAECEKQMAKVWEEYVKKYASEGYEVENNEIIGKRASDGVSQPNKQRTVRWAEPVSFTEDSKEKFYVEAPDEFAKVVIDDTKFEEVVKNPEEK